MDGVRRGGGPSEPGGDHYFSASPASRDERREVTVRLGGADLTLIAGGGVFSGARLDPGTSVLLREAPPPPGTGDLLDLGCGWGAIAVSLALTAPGARVWAVDVNPRALDMTRENAGRAARARPCAPITACAPHDVPPDVEFAAIWSNPPIRVGKAALHDLLAQWLPRLAPGGEAHLVVSKHLGADSLATWLADQRRPDGAPWGEVERLGSSKGFRVLRVRR